MDPNVNTTNPGVNPLTGVSDQGQTVVPTDQPQQAPSAPAEPEPMTPPVEPTAVPEPVSIPQPTPEPPVGSGNLGGIPPVQQQP